MTRRLIVARRAEIQIAKAQRWWRAHRDAVDLLSQELDEAFSLIRQYPHIGKSVQTRHGKFMRRVTLDGTRYLLYYRVRDDAVEVAALWHGSRRPPRL
jgi:plasmid stabilization system protein ParE